MNMGYRRIGLTPDGRGSIFLPRLIGKKRLMNCSPSRNRDMEKSK
jgi:enoyl-CoA hydratase/carnithine racemase